MAFMLWYTTGTGFFLYFGRSANARALSNQTSISQSGAGLRLGGTVISLAIKGHLCEGKRKRGSKQDVRPGAGGRHSLLPDQGP